MLKQVNYGIIGCGTISNTHIENLKKIPNAKLTAVSDKYEPKLREVSQKEGVEGFTDYHQMLQKKDLDAVIVLTSSGTHAQIGIEAARAGKHVIVEKPIDTTVEKAQELIDVCREEKVLLSCIFQHRFDPSAAAAKEVLEKGWLGRVTSCCCRTTWYRDEAYYASVDWRGTLRYDGGGALINQSIHYIDLMQYLLGEPDEVFGYTATLAHTGMEGEDVGVAVVRFPDGVLGTIEGTTSAYPGFSASLGIYGSEGSIVIENDTISIWNLKNGEKCTEQKAVHSAHRSQLQNITDAIVHGKEPEVNGEEALKALKIVRAVYRSVQEGRPVRL